ARAELPGAADPLPRVQPAPAAPTAGRGRGAGPTLRPEDPDALFAVPWLLARVLGGHALAADARNGGRACLSAPGNADEANAGQAPRRRADRRRSAGGDPPHPARRAGRPGSNRPRP